MSLLPSLLAQSHLPPTFYWLIFLITEKKFLQSLPLLNLSLRKKKKNHLPPLSSQPLREAPRPQASIARTT